VRLSLVLVGILLIGLAMGGLLATHIDDVSNAKSEYEAASDEYRRFQCIRSLVLARVSSNEIVRIDETDPHWYQRLFELSSPERNVTDSLDWDEVDVRLSIARAPNLPCGDTGVNVIRRD